MEWSNEVVMEFLDLYKAEPVIWDPRNPDHQDRNLVYDGWKRIQSNLSIECSLKELKKKRENLMATYRKCEMKVKSSAQTVAEANDVYKPEWFAYDKMKSFLRTIYTPRTKTTQMDIQTDFSSDVEMIKTEPDPSAILSIIRQVEPKEQTSELEIGETRDSVQINNDEFSAFSETEEESGTVKHLQIGAKRKRESQFSVALDGLQDGLSILIDKLQKISDDSRNSEDEFDFFAKSLAVQLRKMPLQRALICQANLQRVMAEERMFQFNQNSAIKNN